MTLAALAAAALGAACSHQPRLPEQALPALELQPASLGRTLMLQQRVTAQAPGGAPAQFDALLEADAHAVRLAVVSLGLTVARLDWDGRALKSELAAGWPPGLRAERVLQDLQLALWPAAVLRAALPRPWSLVDEPGRRRLMHEDEDIVVITYPDATRIEIEHRRDGLRLSIESNTLTP